MALTIEGLKRMSEEEAELAIFEEFIKCKEDLLYCIQTYFTVLDSETGERISADLYPYQKTAVKSFGKRRYNMTMKTRQTGLTTIATLYAAAYMCTHENRVVYALANKLKTSRKFLRMTRQALDNARKTAPWLIGDYDKSDNGKDSFTIETGCQIVAESNTEEAGRGETINLLFIDEVAAIDKQNPGRMEEIWSSAGPTLTKSKGTCIAISTPKGQSGWYFDQYTNAEENGWNIIEAHWSAHPDYNKGMYMFVKNIKDKQLVSALEMYNIKVAKQVKVPSGGLLVFFNNTWPNTEHPDDLLRYKTFDTYDFILDGKLRSPYYDSESKRLGPQKTKCELDCTFSGSGGEVLDTEIMRALELFARRNPPLKKKEQRQGIWKSYKEYRNYNPHHSYVVSCDVATGDGSDYSTITVIDIQTLEVVATYKDRIYPNVFADIISQVGIKYGNAMAVVENAGGGLATLLELKTLKYPRIYNHTLKSKDPTTREKRKKLGFIQGAETRQLGGDKLEESIITDELKIYCESIVAELHTWIWDKDGKRRHAPGKNDDLIMALQMGLYYIAFVEKRNRTKNQIMNTTFGIQRSDWEKQSGGFNPDQPGYRIMM